MKEVVTIIKKFLLFTASRMMQPINPALIAILGAYTVLWGLWVANPFWDVFSSAPLYSKMAELPEWAWGLFAMGSGFEMIRGVLRNSNSALRRGAFVGYFHWLVITFMYFAGDWHNTGGITSMTLSLYSLIVYLNYKKNPDHP